MDEVSNDERTERYRGAIWGKANTNAAVRAVMAVADAEQDALRAEVERLRRWKAEATEVTLGLQDLGRALGVGLGEQITGQSGLDAAKRLTARAEASEAKVARVEALADKLWSESREIADPKNSVRIIYGHIVAQFRNALDLPAGHVCPECEQGKHAKDTDRLEVRAKAAEDAVARVEALLKAWDELPDYMPSHYDRGRVDQRHMAAEELATALGVPGRPLAEGHVCPECEQGKHANCDGTAWDDAMDEPTSCTCRLHEGVS